MIPYLPKILDILERKSQIANTDLQGVVADTLGTITLHLVNQASQNTPQIDLFKKIVDCPARLLKSKNKVLLLYFLLVFVDP